MVRLAVISVELGDPVPVEFVSPPLVNERKFSLKSVPPPPPPEGRMVMVRLVLATPTEFDAEILIIFVPATGLAPEITPLVVLMVAHPGKLEAPKEVGEFEAVIW